MTNIPQKSYNRKTTTLATLFDDDFKQWLFIQMPKINLREFFLSEKATYLF